MRFLIFALISLPAFANEFTIANWREVQGIDARQASQMAYAAMAQDLGVDEDGQVCTIGDAWGFGREQNLSADYPQTRGEIFSILGLVEGPDSRYGCSGTETYECRVVFNKPPKTQKWQVEYTDCEPVDIR